MRSRQLSSILWAALVVVLLAGCANRVTPPTGSRVYLPRPEAVQQAPRAPVVPTPRWVTVPPVRAPGSNLGAVLGDIDSHMPERHIYRDNDRVTWGHETTHGLDSRIRNAYGGGTNAFYALKNRAIVLREPRTTIASVALYVPPSLRGAITWDPYMVGRAARDWNSQPLYILDELAAYTNGSNVGLDLAYRGMWPNKQRSDTLQNMLEFHVYSMTLCWVVVNRCPGYDAEPLKNFVMWEIYRGRALLQFSKQFPAFASASHDRYCQTLATSPDADRLRRFARAYFGPEWCAQVLGF